MKLDCHIHSKIADSDRAGFISNLQAGGFDGGIVMSHSPLKEYGEPPSPQTRMDAVPKLTGGHPHLFPFYWIDPTEPDALKQVELAERKGILGYKVICSHHFPCDERVLPVYRAMAALNRPLLFHSGILWDGRNASGNFNRPCNFEGLLAVDNLRFALAHVSWPWTDECIALYGKLNDARRSFPHAGPGAEMFIDLTPGTPLPYRKPMFERLLFSGYDIKTNLLYGIDNYTHPYNAAYAQEWLARDESIFEEYERLGGMFGQPLDADFREHLYALNLLRFIGKGAA